MIFRDSERFNKQCKGDDNYAEQVIQDTIAKLTEWLANRGGVPEDEALAKAKQIIACHTLGCGSFEEAYKGLSGERELAVETLVDEKLRRCKSKSLEKAARKAFQPIEYLDSEIDELIRNTKALSNRIDRLAGGAGGRR